MPEVCKVNCLCKKVMEVTKKPQTRWYHLMMKFRPLRPKQTLS